MLTEIAYPVFLEEIQFLLKLNSIFGSVVLYTKLINPAIFHPVKDSMIFSISSADKLNFLYL